MDDIMDKLSGLLSDEESVKQLSDLAKMMMSGELSDESGENANAEGSSGGDDSALSGLPDIGALMKLTSLAGAFSQNDKNSGLLLALRPHLSPERQQRVDKALKLLKVIAVFNMARESGLLNDIL